MKTPLTRESHELIGWLALSFGPPAEILVELEAHIKRIELAAAEREYQGLATRWQEVYRREREVTFLDIFERSPQDREVRP